MGAWWVVAIALTAAVPASRQQAAATSEALLQKNAMVERPLAHGETHAYRIALAVGEYVRVGVRGTGIHLSISAATPDGQAIPTVAWNHLVRPERLALLADSPGEYSVTVTGVAGGDDRGSYRIWVDERRASVAADRHRVQAQGAWAASDRLRRKPTAESLRRALEALRDALGHWEAAGDRTEQAVTLGFLGSVYFALAEYQQAVDHHSRALSMYQAERDRLGQGEALGNIGTARYSLGELEAARESFLLALPLRRETGDRQGEAATLNNLGSLYRAVGDPQRALATYTALLPVRRDLRDQAGEARTLNNIGTVYDDMAEHRLALEYYLQALPLRRGVGDRAGEANTLSNLGMTHNRLGRVADSLEYFDQSLQLAKAIGNRDREAATLRAIAGALQSLGRLEQATAHAERALALYRDLEARWDEGLTLTLLGRLLTQRGQFEAARRTSGEARDVCRSIGARRCHANALNHLGDIALARDEWERAATLFRQALDIRVAILDPTGQAESWLGLAHVERAKGRLAIARDCAESALALIESERARIEVDDLRASYFAVKHDAFAFHLDLLMELHARDPEHGYDRLALDASERSRARTLLDLLSEAPAAIRASVPPELLAEEQAVRQRLNALETARVRARSDSGAKAKERGRTIQELLLQHRQLRARIRAESPRYAALTDPEPLTTAEIQRDVLDEGTVLLQYALGTGRSVLWLVTPRRVESFLLPPQVEIETAARRAFDLLTVSHTRQRRREAERAADALAGMVLGPVAGRLAAHRLVIVSDGALQYIPFGALRVASVPLIARHEIVSIPSASALAVIRKETARRSPAPRLLAVLADPVLEPGDPRVPGGAREPAATPFASGASSELLRSARDTGVSRFERLVHTRDEAQAILALADPAERLRALDFDASRETALRPDLADYRFLHFATHGLLNGRDPGLSGLVLSLVDPGGRPQDGFLRAHDIYNLRLGADLVVLSACRTALGTEIRGEGLLGLVRGFMYAGAPRVVASLWDVRDDATAELMKRFYTRMIREHLPPSTALREAQLSMATDDRWSAPYYWAGFVLQGEWR